MPITALWRLSRTWYEGRLTRRFRPRPVERSQALLTEAGLTSDFWQLAG